MLVELVEEGVEAEAEPLVQPLAGPPEAICFGPWVDALLRPRTPMTNPLQLLALPPLSCSKPLGKLGPGRDEALEPATEPVAGSTVCLRNRSLLAGRCKILADLC